MSFDLGKDAAFTPPPPPKRRLSPWAMTGIGCLVLLVGGVIAVSVVAVKFSNTMKVELAKPIHKEEILAELGDTPLFPGIQFDEQVTKTSRAAMLAMLAFRRGSASQKVVIGGFRTTESADKVYSWYSEKLGLLGFHSEDGRGGPRGGRAFRRDREMVLVQVESQKGEWNGLMLVHFHGMRK
jgi:hypothetical protein